MSGDPSETPPRDLKEDSVDNTSKAQDESSATRPNELNLNINLPQPIRRPLSVQRSSVRRSVNRLESWTQENLETPPSQATVNEANALYFLMLTEQMRQLGLELNDLGSTYRHRPGYWNARSLRALAERFAHSRQRSWVHEQAMNVDLDSLNFATFQQLLNGLFQEGGVTWERVLVLFYFCTDLSIRTFQEKFVNHFVNIYHWTTVFLSGRFSAWVEAQGGWATVLGNSMGYLTTAALTATLSIIVAACYAYFKRR